MKSKATTYFLIAGVAIIWGIVIWRIFLTGDDGLHTDMPQGKAAVAEKTADTLMLNYRDPFLAVSPAPEKPATPSPAVAQPPTAAEEPAEENTLHNLRYMGKITREKTVYALVEIDGTLHTIKPGDSVGEYRLESIGADAVKLKWKGTVCTVTLGN